MSSRRPPTAQGSLPASPGAQQAVIEYGFIPLEVAAFLDRVERHGVADDFRCAALREAALLLVDGQPERARRILEKFSDPTTEPETKSSGKAALGAWRAPAK